MMSHASGDSTKNIWMGKSNRDKHPKRRRFRSFEQFAEVFRKPETLNLTEEQFHGLPKSQQNDLKNGRYYIAASLKRDLRRL